MGSGLDNSTSIHIDRMLVRYVMFRDLGDLGGSVDREKAIDWLNGLEEHNNSVQNTEPPESRVVLNRVD